MRIWRSWSTLSSMRLRYQSSRVSGSPPNECGNCLHPKSEWQSSAIIKEQPTYSPLLVTVITASVISRLENSGQVYIFHVLHMTQYYNSNNNNNYNTNMHNRKVPSQLHHPVTAPSSFHVSHIQSAQWQQRPAASILSGFWLHAKSPKIFSVYIANRASFIFLSNIGQLLPALIQSYV